MADQFITHDMDEHHENNPENVKYKTPLSNEATFICQTKQYPFDYL